jgi:hypothetical protein
LVKANVVLRVRKSRNLAPDSLIAEIKRETSRHSEMALAAHGCIAKASVLLGSKVPFHRVPFACLGKDEVRVTTDLGGYY